MTMAAICIFGRSVIRPTKWTTFTRGTESRPAPRQTGTASPTSREIYSSLIVSCRTACGLSRCIKKRTAASRSWCTSTTASTPSAIHSRIWNTGTECGPRCPAACGQARCSSNRTVFPGFFCYLLGLRTGAPSCNRRLVAERQFFLFS